MTPYDPNPMAISPATNGWILCPHCEQVVQLPHACPPPSLFGILPPIPTIDIRLSDIDVARAERAESVLCALAFDEARQVIEVRHGEGCDRGHPDRGCIFCEAAR